MTKLMVPDDRLFPEGEFEAEVCAVELATKDGRPELVVTFRVGVSTSEGEFRCAADFGITERGRRTIAVELVEVLLGRVLERGDVVDSEKDLLGCRCRVRVSRSSNADYRWTYHVRGVSRLGGRHFVTQAVW